MHMYAHAEIISSEPIYYSTKINTDRVEWGKAGQIMK